MSPHSSGIPPYDKWMKETHSWTKPRSKELKEIDEAIKDYGNSMPPGRDAKFYNIRYVLNAWKAKEGTHWMRSVRNGTGVITALDGFLNGTVHGPGLSQDERAAWELVKQAARENCRHLLGGKQLSVKNTVIGGTLSDIGMTARSIYSMSSTAHDIAKGVAPLAYQGSKAAISATAAVSKTALEHAAHELLKASLDVADIHAVMDALGPMFGEVMKAITPFLGMISNGASAAMGWAQVIRQGWERHKLREITGAFAPGDPSAAFDAILVIVTRNLHAQIGDASITTGAFALQTGLFFADGGAISGPVVGVASSISKLISKLIQFGRDLKEMKAANKQLTAGPWDLTLFKTCPLLGCYLIACSDTSSVINLAIDEFGSYQWVDKIEMLKSKADPAIQKAGDLIRASRYEIRDLRQSKGVVVPHPKVTGHSPIAHAQGLAASFSSMGQKLGNKVNVPMPSRPFKHG